MLSIFMFFIFFGYQNETPSKLIRIKSIEKIQTEPLKSFIKEKMVDASRISSELSPELDNFIGYILKTTLAEMYGVASSESIRLNKDCYALIKTKEAVIRNEVYNFIKTDSSLHKIAPSYGSYLLFVESFFEQPDELKTWRKKSKGDSLGRPIFSITYGSKENLEKKEQFSVFETNLNIHMIVTHKERYICTLTYFYNIPKELIEQEKKIH